MALFTQDSWAEDLFCGAPSDSEPRLFSGDNFFSLEFGHIQNGFARMADEADGSMVCYGR